MAELAERAAADVAGDGDEDLEQRPTVQRDRLARGPVHERRRAPDQGAGVDRQLGAELEVLAGGLHTPSERGPDAAQRPVCAVGHAHEPGPCIADDVGGPEVRIGGQHGEDLDGEALREPAAEHVDQGHPRSRDPDIPAIQGDAPEACTLR